MEVEYLMDLEREFSSGGEHEAARCTRLAATAGQPHEQWKSEREGLPRSGRGASEDVAAGERIGYGSDLDRKWLGHARTVERVHENYRQSQVCE
ncbi:PAP2 family protein [Rhodococcus sp. AW25M09]|nr:PAP2 family protein [Rhodococcus sp. AW25M09]